MGRVLIVEDDCNRGYRSGIENCISYRLFIVVTMGIENSKLHTVISWCNAIVCQIQIVGYIQAAVVLELQQQTPS